MLVWGDCYLSRIDPKVQVATGQVIRPECLNVSIELDARIAIGLGVPAQPTACVQVKQPAKCRFAESFGADQANVVDLCSFALGHAEGQIDPITLNGRDCGDHLRTIQAAINILSFEFLLGLVCQGLVKGLTFIKSCIAHRFFQKVFVEFFVAYKINAGHGRPLFNNHHQHVTTDFQPNILEKTQCKQSANSG